MTSRTAGTPDPGTPNPGTDEPHDPNLCDAAITRAFTFLGKRWNGVILASLSHGPVGFAELRRGVGGITDSVLSDRLTELSVAGLVVRTVSDARPPAVRYELSPAGRSLIPVFDQLAGWAAENLPDRPCTG